MKRIAAIGCVALAVAIAPATHAQFTGNYQTNIISGVVSNWNWWTGDYYVGSNTVCDQLQVINAGYLTTYRAHVGEYGKADSALIDGSGSVWSNANELYIGFAGMSNWVLVSNGGTLICSEGFIFGTNNDVLITGAGSTWKLGTPSPSLVAGDYYSSGTSLTISNGGLVTAASDAWIGDTAYSNTVRVTGTGSRMMVGSLKVGYSSVPSRNARSAGNSLVVEGGGAVVSASANVGSALFGAASSNTVVISGIGSVWSNQGAITVGGPAPPGPVLDNAVIIDNGATVACGGMTVNNSLKLVNGNLCVAGNLTISAPAGLLEGAGTISGTVVNSGRISAGYPGGILTFTGAVTNNGTISAVNGGFLAFNGPVINTGSIVTTNGGLRFYAGIVNNGTVLLDSAGDADGDGMANGWEQAYGLDPLNATDAGTDTDGDGLTSLQEFKAGTDPTNSASAFRILSVVPTNDDVLVSWTAGGDRTNVVQSSSEVAGSYSNVSPNIILTNAPGVVTTNYLDAGGATNGASRYYKIRLVP